MSATIRLQCWRSVTSALSIFYLCTSSHASFLSRQDHTQPTGFQEHTLGGILMSWTHAELPSLAAISVICWLSKAHSGFFFSLDTVDRHRFYVPTLLYFWHSSHRIAGQRKTSSTNRGCFLHVSVLPQSSLKLIPPSLPLFPISSDAKLEAMAEDALTATQNLNKICLQWYCAFQAGWLSFLSHSLTKKLKALVYLWVFKLF